MTDTTNNQTAASKTPSHIVYHVREREGGHSGLRNTVADRRRDADESDRVRLRAAAAR